MTDQAVEKLTITKTTYPIGSILERPGKTAKVLGVSIKNNEFKGYHCNITIIAADNSVREQQGLLSVRDLEVLPERGGWSLRKAEVATFKDQDDLREHLGLPPARHSMPKLTAFFEAEAARQTTSGQPETVAVELEVEAPTPQLSVEDQLVLKAADEIYSLDWRENDDDHKTAGWRHPGYFTEVNLAYDFSKLVAMGLMECDNNTEHTPSYRISDRGAKFANALAAKSVTNDIELTATAQLIADLRERNELLQDRNQRLESQIEELVTSRDSAIAHDAAADDRASEHDELERGQINLAHKRFEELHEQGAAKYGTGWLTANMQVNRLAESEYAPVDMYGESDIRVKALLSETAMTIAAQNSEIATLTEQLAEARLASTPVQSAPAADVIVAPKEEVTTLIQSLSKPETDDELAHFLNQEWRILNITVTNAFWQHEATESFTRVVTLIRTCKPEPVMPRPIATVSIQPVGKTMTIITANTPTPMSSAEVRQAHYASIITNRNLTTEQKRDLLNNHLIAAGTESYQAASTALSQPARSLSEMNHD